MRSHTGGSSSIEHEWGGFTLIHVWDPIKTKWRASFKSVRKSMSEEGVLSVCQCCQLCLFDGQIITHFWQFSKVLHTFTKFFSSKQSWQHCVKTNPHLVTDHHLQTCASKYKALKPDDSCLKLLIVPTCFNYNLHSVGHIWFIFSVLYHVQMGSIFENPLKIWFHDLQVHRPIIQTNEFHLMISILNHLPEMKKKKSIGVG